MPISFAEVPGGRGPHRLEYRWINRDQHQKPLVVFLHEGLWCLSMWRDYPQQLCHAGGFRGLVYSRYGYGQSTPRPPAERWPVTYLRDQAVDAFPHFLRAVGAEGQRPWLFGHSDGGSIALIYAATYPESVAGIVVLAPHIFVEDVTIAGITQTKILYETTDLKQKLGRHHAHPDSAFWGWNDAWLDPAFRTMNIEALLPAIRCPVMAIQGYDDEYATMAQLDGIKQGVPHAQLLKLSACGHSPHRDQSAAVTAAAVPFMARQARETRP